MNYPPQMQGQPQPSGPGSPPMPQQQQVPPMPQQQQVPAAAKRAMLMHLAQVAQQHMAPKRG